MVNYVKRIVILKYMSPNAIESLVLVEHVTFENVLKSLNLKINNKIV